MVGCDILEEIRLFMQDQNQNTQINGQNGMVASALGGVGGAGFGVSSDTVVGRDAIAG